jgi:hypothetical protein
MTMKDDCSKLQEIASYLSVFNSRSSLDEAGTEDQDNQDPNDTLCNQRARLRRYLQEAINICDECARQTRALEAASAEDNEETTTANKDTPSDVSKRAKE